VTRFRAFRNTDPPALVKLWNQRLTGRGVARPLEVHELDEHAFGTVNFDAAGVIVAEREGRVVGYAHAGFGPDLPVNATRPFELSFDMGTVAVSIAEPNGDEAELIQGLMIAAEGYLIDRGAKVIYAGSLYPLNPFYWGLMGGSEGAGILSGQEPLKRILLERGYEAVSSTLVFEADLGKVETRDSRTALIRRQTTLDVQDDAMPSDWWQSIWVGNFNLTRFRLISKLSGEEFGRAMTWEMNSFARESGKMRLGIVDVEVGAAHRRKGYARFMIGEISRRARDECYSVLEVQTGATNTAGVGLYRSMGFQAVDQATLYRRAASR
jgi:GNAT superfamily N-acetyltransferase